VTLAGLILAGGRATRLGGRAKPLVPAGATSILERQLDVLAPRVDEIVIALAHAGVPLPIPPAHAARVRFIHDAAPGQGPLAGLAAAGRSYQVGPTFLVLAGDLPHVSGAVLDLLIGASAADVDAVAFRVGGLPEPLLAVYGPAAVEAAARRIDAGKRKAAGLLLEEGLRVRWIEEDALRAVDPQLHSLDDVDTPEDLERLRHH
jgi:molybdopterin-guanine dinucleotide biosynthesis protein A